MRASTGNVLDPRDNRSSEPRFSKNTSNPFIIYRNHLKKITFYFERNFFNFSPWYVIKIKLTEERSKLLPATSLVSTLLTCYTRGVVFFFFSLSLSLSAGSGARARVTSVAREKGWKLIFVRTGVFLGVPFCATFRRLLFCRSFIK